MALISFTHTRLTGGIYRITWPALDAGDTGSIFAIASEMEGTVQASAPGAPGGTVSLQGSLLAAAANGDAIASGNWAILNDPQGGPLTLTAPAIEKIQESLVHVIRPVANVGAVDVTVTVIYRDRKVD